MKAIIEAISRYYQFTSYTVDTITTSNGTKLNIVQPPFQKYPKFSFVNYQNVEIAELKIFSKINNTLEDLEDIKYDDKVASNHIIDDEELAKHIEYKKVDLATERKNLFIKLIQSIKKLKNVGQK